MATQQSTRSIRMERQKAKDLQILLSSLNHVTKQHPSLSNVQIMNKVQRYFNNIQNNLQSQINDYTLSKFKLIQSTNNEINRMRYLIQQLNNHICLHNNIQINTRQRESVISLSLSPIVLSSPEIDMQPLDLHDIPQNFRPRRYSHIPAVYTGKYKIETILPGNGLDYPYPNDKVTVRYTMFAIDGILDLMESYIHQVLDLSSPTCMIGLKYGILSMSTQQKCKLWIPKRLTSYYNNKGVSVTQTCDILIEIELLNIIRSDIYKNTTYTNDIVLNASKQRHKRANTVSLTPPPLTPVPIPKTQLQKHSNTQKNNKNIVYSFVIDNMDVSELNQQFPAPDLSSFGGHIHHQNTDEINNNDMKLLINDMQHNLPVPILEMDEDKSEYNESDDDNSETHLLDISGIKSVWMNAYKSICNNETVEQCMTLCAKIEACDCTQRLLMILKIYQSIMYNRQRVLWNISEINNTLISMYYVIRNELKFDLYYVINDFYHCRFYHGHFNRWYDFCRTHFEENYCVYDTSECHRHCTIYNRYHRHKYKCKVLSKRREWFKINADDGDDDGLSEPEINEIITLQICDMIHCFIFHSSQEPYLMYANQYDNTIANMNEFKMKMKKRNRIQTNKFTFNICNDNSEDLFEYDGESFGVLISYKDRTFTPAFTAMKDELINNKLIGGISIHQYIDTTYLARIFQQTFIGQTFCDSECKNDDIMVVIGAKRLGSLYFDVSLLSDYPYENEILLGPSQHLEIHNIIINNYDNEIYFRWSFKPYKLSFNYEENINYQTYLSQIDNCRYIVL